MFKRALEDKLKEIFGTPVSFDAAGDAFEQDKLFVDVIEAPSRVTGVKVIAKVSGLLTIFASSERHPYGFFAKRISAAEASAKQNLFFFDLDTNNLASPSRLQNLSEIRTRFVYLHSAQHNPNQGTLTELDYTDEFYINPLAPTDGTLLDTGDGTPLGASK